MFFFSLSPNTPLFKKSLSPFTLLLQNHTLPFILLCKNGHTLPWGRESKGKRKKNMVQHVQIQCVKSSKISCYEYGCIIQYYSITKLAWICSLVKERKQKREKITSSSITNMLSLRTEYGCPLNVRTKCAFGLAYACSTTAMTPLRSCRVKEWKTIEVPVCTWLTNFFAFFSNITQLYVVEPLTETLTPQFHNFNSSVSKIQKIDFINDL